MYVVKHINCWCSFPKFLLFFAPDNGILCKKKKSKLCNVQVYIYIYQTASPNIACKLSLVLVHIREIFKGLKYTMALSLSIIFRTCSIDTLMGISRSCLAMHPNSETLMWNKNCWQFDIFAIGEADWHRDCLPIRNNVVTTWCALSAPVTSLHFWYRYLDICLIRSHALSRSTI